MWVKPAPGLRVRDPDTKQLLPETGIEVPDDSIIWNKLLNDGDVVKTSTPIDETQDTEGAKE